MPNTLTPISTEVPIPEDIPLSRIVKALNELNKGADAYRVVYLLSDELLAEVTAVMERKA